MALRESSVGVTDNVTMLRYVILLNLAIFAYSQNLEYLDPTKLQTKKSAAIQERTAKDLLQGYFKRYKDKNNLAWTTLSFENVDVEVNTNMFQSNKDSFHIKCSDNRLKIKASTGVAALWGFHYYMKKYCKSHEGWQVQHLTYPNPLPEAEETVVANDRFRYYQNVCTASYSFVWWKYEDWAQHLLWMAFNGINLALAPVAQEAAWRKIYEQVGMTENEINDHFSGPAFLSWQRMGNVRFWGGPLFDSWHNAQRYNQNNTVELMHNLGMVPVYPAFAGHVPRAFTRLYPNTTFHEVTSWNGFQDTYCCGLFLDPSESLFKTMGTMFLREVNSIYEGSHIYTADPFNEVSLHGHWSTALVEGTSKAIFTTMEGYDNKAVWLLQNWMFVHDSSIWPKSRVKAFITAVPKGRMLILDLQSEQWPQYDLYEMYFGQPFIWCMLHNFGGTLGMFGSMETINTVVYEARKRNDTTMIGIGLTPEGINQNYVVYDLMLESAWRKGPVDLNTWVGEYAERRYGCNTTTEAWKYLVKSVYNFTALNKVRGKYVVTRRPSFWIRPWAWYSSEDLLKAFGKFAFADCSGDGYNHDLVDVTRQVMQYRAEQLYMKLLVDKNSNTWVFNASINRFLDAMDDMRMILASNRDFSASQWFEKAKSFAANENEEYTYLLDARNQITLWGPNGEISDYACKQWSEMFTHYYIPRWRTFLSAALSAKMMKEVFDERSVHGIIKTTVEKDFQYEDIYPIFSGDTRLIAQILYKKWIIVPSLPDLPITLITEKRSTAVKEKVFAKGKAEKDPEVILMTSTTTTI